MYLNNNRYRVLKLSTKPFYLEHSRAETNRKLPNSTPFRRTIPRPKAYECRRTSLLRHPRDRPGGQLAIMLAGVLCPVLAGGTEGKSRIPQPLRRNPQLRAGLPRHLQILSTDATSRKFSRLIVRSQLPPNSSTKASSKAVGPSENIPPLPTEIRVLFSATNESHWFPYSILVAQGRQVHRTHKRHVSSVSSFMWCSTLSLGTSE